MFRGGLGVQELIIILVIILLLFGPKQIPKLSRMFGKAMKDMKDGLEGKVDDEPEILPPGKAESEDAAKKKVEENSEV